MYLVFMKNSFELNQNALNFIHLIFFIYSAQIGHEQPALHQLINSVVEDQRNLIYLKKKFFNLRPDDYSGEDRQSGKDR